MTPSFLTGLCSGIVQRFFYDRTSEEDCWFMGSDLELTGVHEKVQAEHRAGRKGRTGESLCIHHAALC